MSSSLRSRLNAELERIRHENGGFVKPAAVVEFAKCTDTALHEEFSRHGLWDDAKAAEQARLAHAARLIRVYIIRDTDDQRPPVRALVSLLEDRKARSGFPGYRHIEDVMKDEDLRANLLETALMELRAARRKYESLKELSGVWAALDAVQGKSTQQPDNNQAAL